MAIEPYLDAEGNLHMPDADIGEIKDYEIIWADRIADEGDIMATVVWTVPTGLTKTDENLNLTDKITTIWLSHDAIGDYQFKCTITTTDNGADQTYIRVVYLSVV